MLLFRNANKFGPMASRLEELRLYNELHVRLAPSLREEVQVASKAESRGVRPRGRSARRRAALRRLSEAFGAHGT